MSSTRVQVWCLFLGSAICLVLQIAQELALPPGEIGDTSWGAYATSWAVTACLLLAYEK
jgi:hypothetical protein